MEKAAHTPKKQAKEISSSDRAGRTLAARRNAEASAANDSIVKK